MLRDLASMRRIAPNLFTSAVGRRSVITEPAKDPLSVWRDLISQWEQQINTTANQMMGRPEFGQSLHQFTGLSLQLQQVVTEIMGRYLEALNLPSRAEITGLAERLRSIEDILTRIETSLNDAGFSSKRTAQSRPLPTPSRTRRPANRQEKS